MDAPLIARLSLGEREAALLKLARFAKALMDGFPEALYTEGLWDDAVKQGVIVFRVEKHKLEEECEVCDDGNEPCYVIAPDVAAVLAELKP